MKGNELLEDDIVAQAYVESLATKVFTNGIKAVDSGTATAKTSDTLQAAALFLELTKLFTTEPDPEILQKIKCAKFYAARILKAIKEGTDLNPPPAPMPRPPSPTIEEITDESFVNKPSNPTPSPHDVPMASDMGALSNDVPFQQPFFSSVPNVLQGQSNIDLGNTVFAGSGQPNPFDPPSAPALLPTAPPPVSASPPPAPEPFPPPSFNMPALDQFSQPSAFPPPPPRQTMPTKKLHPDDIAKAQKYAKWAISALDYEDVDNAILQLRNGLAALGAQ